MEQWTQLAEYGIAIPLIAALVYVVKLFANYVQKSQSEILNHVSESTKASQEQADTNQKLSETISEMLTWLHRANGSRDKDTRGGL